MLRFLNKKKGKKRYRKSTNYLIPYESILKYPVDHKNEALKHSGIYTKILNEYYESIKRSLILKNLLKIIFFIITMVAFGVVVYIFSKSLTDVYELLKSLLEKEKVNTESIIGMITIVVPAACSLIVALVKIPKIIAKYLFNKEEDNYISKIIKDIQDYDRDVLSIEKDLQLALKQEKDSDNPEQKDNEMIDPDKKEKDNYTGQLFFRL